MAYDNRPTLKTLKEPTDRLLLLLPSPPTLLLRMIMNTVMMLMMTKIVIDAEPVKDPASPVRVSPAMSSLSGIQRMQLINKNALHSERACTSHYDVRISLNRGLEPLMPQMFAAV